MVARAWRPAGVDTNDDTFDEPGHYLASEPQVDTKPMSAVEPVPTIVPPCEPRVTAPIPEQIHPSVTNQTVDTFAFWRGHMGTATPPFRVPHVVIGGRDVEVSAYHHRCRVVDISHVRRQRVEPFEFVDVMRVGELPAIRSVDTHNRQWATPRRYEPGFDRPVPHRRTREFGAGDLEPDTRRDGDTVSSAPTPTDVSDPEPATFEQGVRELTVIATCLRHGDDVDVMSNTPVENQIGTNPHRVDVPRRNPQTTRHVRRPSTTGN